MNNTLRKVAAGVVTYGTLAYLGAFPVLAQTIDIEPPEGGVTSLSRFFTSAIRIAIVIAAILTFAYLIWGGVQWITSGGDKSAMEAARGRITAAIIGLAIVAAAWALMSLIGYFFGVDPFNLDIESASSDPPDVDFD